MARIEERVLFWGRHLRSNPCLGYWLTLRAILCYLEMYWRDHCSLGYQAFAFCIRHHIGNPRTKVAWGFRDTRLEISCSAALVDYFPNMVLSSW